MKKRTVHSESDEMNAGSEKKKQKQEEKGGLDILVATSSSSSHSKSSHSSSSSSSDHSVGVNHAAYLNFEVNERSSESQQCTEEDSLPRAEKEEVLAAIRKIIEHAVQFTPLFKRRKKRTEEKQKSQPPKAKKAYRPITLKDESSTSEEELGQAVNMDTAKELTLLLWRSLADLRPLSDPRKLQHLKRLAGLRKAMLLVNNSWHSGAKTDNVILKDVCSITRKLFYRRQEGSQSREGLRYLKVDEARTRRLFEAACVDAVHVRQMTQTEGANVVSDVNRYERQKVQGISEQGAISKLKQDEKNQKAIARIMCNVCQHWRGRTYHRGRPLVQLRYVVAVDAENFEGEFEDVKVNQWPSDSYESSCIEENEGTLLRACEKCGACLTIGCEKQFVRAWSDFTLMSELSEQDQNDLCKIALSLLLSLLDRAKDAVA